MIQRCVYILNAQLIAVVSFFNDHFVIKWCYEVTLVYLWLGLYSHVTYTLGKRDNIPLFNRSVSYNFYFWLVSFVEFFFECLLNRTVNACDCCHIAENGSLYCLKIISGSMRIHVWKTIDTNYL